jgi:hypothetical protein
VPALTKEQDMAQYLLSVHSADTPDGARSYEIMGPHWAASEGRSQPR